MRTKIYLVSCLIITLLITSCSFERMAKYTEVAQSADYLDDMGIPMALVPAGEFMMGSEDFDSDVDFDEKPQHKAYLDAYYIDVYEVTHARYAECVADGRCSLPTITQYYDNIFYADHPVVFVTWNMARAYCNWRGARLPSEAQWEKAARGGLESAKYPWGDYGPVCQKGAENGAKFNDRDRCNNTGTAPVGSFAPNGYGLYDMVGNALEWVMDWYQNNSGC